MDLPTYEGVSDAFNLIRPYHPPTPLVRSECLSRAFDADIWLKIETVSAVGSFKLRGALTEILRVRSHGSIVGAVTASTGNHGQGVAYASRILDIPANIFLPAGANLVKKAMIELLGGKVHMVGEEVDLDTKRAAREFAKEMGHTFVDDGEGLGVMEGAGTVGLEIARRLDDIYATFLPIGSGSLAAGCGAALKALQPKMRVIGVPAKGAPAMYESFRAGRVIEGSVRPGMVADGLAGRSPTELALQSLLKFLDDAVLVDDEETLASIHTLSATAHVLVEPSGAAAFAAAWHCREKLRNRRVVVVLTGANISMDTLKRALGVAPFFNINLECRNVN
jgi:threonine dehydratase